MTAAMLDADERRELASMSRKTRAAFLAILRNYVTPICGYAQLIADETSARQSVRGNARTIDRQAQAMVREIEALIGGGQ